MLTLRCRGLAGAAMVPRQSRRPLVAARYRPDPGAPSRVPEKQDDDDDDTTAAGLELLRSAVPLVTLDHADAALQEYCSSKPSDEARQACFEVLHYYREKRDAAQRACARELEQQQHSAAASAAPSPSPSPRASSPACASLQSLERLMYETMHCDPSSLYYALCAQRAADEHKQHNDSSAAPHNTAAAADVLRLRALRLFHLADSDGDQRLDREEFLAAMRLMDAELSDGELGAVFSALDARCSLTADQFVDAVTGEALLAAALAERSVDDDGDEQADEEGHVSRRGREFQRRHVHHRQGHGEGEGGADGGEQHHSAAPRCDADVLRRVRHSRPTWWSDAPGYLEMIS